ncbi:nuclear transport factor 2 family protein [Aestuariivirga sp.]|jgi:hypothetical protein|uniref:nuclear transport factor 2 family protein n=1 Tax=Aestuariivirga sp. TaxID=2650926 RepID=UPI0037833975
MRTKTRALGSAVLALFASTASAQSDGTGDLARRAEILQDVIYAYAYEWDGKDCAAWAQLFTADGVFDLSGSASLAATARRAEGTEQIRAFCEKRMSTVLADVSSHHFMTNTVFGKLTPDSAEARTYAFVTWRKNTDPVPVVQNSIIYRDVIVRQNGKWLLKERYVE